MEGKSKKYSRIVLHIGISRKWSPLSRMQDTQFARLSRVLSILHPAWRKDTGSLLRLVSLAIEIFVSLVTDDFFLMGRLDNSASQVWVWVLGCYATEIPVAQKKAPWLP